MLALALLFLATPPISPAGNAIDVSSGAALVKGCDAELRLMQPDALKNASAGDLAEGSYCIGYLHGFLANIHSAETPICTERESMAALLRNYLEFMGDNPSLLGKDKRLGLRLSLEHTYACPAPSNAVVQHPESHRARL